MDLSREGTISAVHRKTTTASAWKSSLQRQSYLRFTSLWPRLGYFW